MFCVWLRHACFEGVCSSWKTQNGPSKDRYSFFFEKFSILIIIKQLYTSTTKNLIIPFTSQSILQQQFKFLYGLWIFMHLCGFNLL